MLLKSPVSFGWLGLVLAFLMPARLLAEGGAPAAELASVDLPALRGLIAEAKERAPEVGIARAALDSSRSALELGRMAPLGNPYLEITAERGSKNVTRDVAVSGALWLPLELSGQRPSRGKEAHDFVALHQSLVEEARAQAAARVVRAYGSTLVGRARALVLLELSKSARSEAELMAERVASGDAIERDASLAAVEAARHEVMLAESRAELLRSESELAEILGHTAPAGVGLLPPLLAGKDFRQVKLERTPRARSLTAEARYFAASARRLEREGRGPLSVALVAGRGDLGETRLGGGLAYAFPMFRNNRPERLRAESESTRALAERRVRETVSARRLSLLELEQAQLREALSVLTNSALPAAERAVSAVEHTYSAGKADVLAVLISRRELSALRLKRLQLVEQQWSLLGEYVEITGDLP